RVPLARRRARLDPCARSRSDPRRVPPLGGSPDDGAGSARMRRAAAAVAAVAAVLAALVVVASAGAGGPPTPGGSVLGRNLPLKVYASIHPGVHLFGDPLTAQVAVVADRKWVAPSNVRVIVHFHPYESAGQPTVTSRSNGRFLQLSWTWQLRC